MQISLSIANRRGRGLGPELMPNPGPFSATTGITAVGVTLGTSGGILTLTAADGTSDRAEFAVTGLEVGFTYRISITAQNGIGTAQRIQTFTGFSAFSPLALTASYAEYVLFLQATATSGTIRAYAANSGGALGDTLLMSAISCRKVS